MRAAWRTVVVLAVLAGATAAGFVLVGWLARREEIEGSFDWELASIFGTAVGTTLLALATGALAFSTWQDVRASQLVAKASADQVEVSREANELTRREQLERLRPAVIAAVDAGSTFTINARGELESGQLNVLLHNVGGGPAVHVEVGAVYVGQDAVPELLTVQGRPIPTLLPNEEKSMALAVLSDGPIASAVNFWDFRVIGHYSDRLGNPAGRIVDWVHDSIESPQPAAP